PHGRDNLAVVGGAVPPPPLLERRRHAATPKKSGPEGFHAYAGSAANNDLRCQRTALCNWAVARQFLSPGELRKRGLAFRATVERAPALLRWENPTAARRSARPPLPLQSIRARRGTGSQKRL